MNCRYCGAWNADDEHRCDRCGRRLNADLGRAQAGSGALAVAIDLSHPPAEAPPAPNRQTQEPQGTLFGPPPPSRLLQFPLRRQDQQAPLAPSHPARARTETVRRSPRRASAEAQQSLAFVTPTITRTPKQASPTIYCEAPVAPAVLRILAAALDVSMMLIGVMTFLLVFSYWSAPIVFNAWTIPSFSIATVLIILLYRVLWLIANSDTAGMRWVGLRLVDFDGYAPARAQRIQRLAASLLSLGAAGLGLLWGLADEESLTWHDHISKTFPTTSAR
jgi:uncharacterized RDD family membrane protein YckC